MSLDAGQLLKILSNLLLYVLLFVYMFFYSHIYTNSNAIAGQVSVKTILAAYWEVSVYKLEKTACNICLDIFAE